MLFAPEASSCDVLDTSRVPDSPIDAVDKGLEPNEVRGTREYKILFVCYILNLYCIYIFFKRKYY